jgi:hypothetical protein
VAPNHRPLAPIVAIVLLAATAYVVARSRRDFVDFEVFRTAAVRALDAEPLYRAEDGHYQFKYWPAFAFAAAPFAFIGEEAGKAVWYALTVGLVALLIRQSIRLLPDRRLSVHALTWWTLLCTGKFIVIELVNGQTNAMLAAVIVLALTAVNRGRPLIAGALVGAAVFVKPYAVILIPWLAASQGPGATAAAAAVVGAGLLAPSAIYGWQGNLDLLTAWYRTVSLTTAENLLVRENISFNTMWANWIGAGVTASWLALITCAASLAGPALIWWKRRAVRQPAYLEVSALVLLMPVISPQGWDYVLLVATPAFVCLVDRFGTSPTGWRAVTLAGLGLTTLVIYDLLGRTLYFAVTRLSVVTIGVLFLLVSLVGLRLRGTA